MFHECSTQPKPKSQQTTLSQRHIFLFVLFLAFVIVFVFVAVYILRIRSDFVLNGISALRIQIRGKCLFSYCTLKNNGAKVQENPHQSWKGHQKHILAIEE